MAESTCIVLDPDAHGRTVGRAWRGCQRRGMRELAPVEVFIARGGDAAEQTAHTAALSGFQRIVAVGDGATVHGVVNGLMRLAPGHRNHLKFGVLTLARPGPEVRGLGLPQSLQGQLEMLSAGNVLPIDVGVAEYTGLAGYRERRHFIAGACFGLVPRLQRRWRAWREAPLERMGLLADTVRGAISQPQPWVRVEQDGGEIYRGPWGVGLVMVGKYYPGYGKVAPEADFADGRLHFVGIAGDSRWKALFGPLGRGRMGASRAMRAGAAFDAGEISGEVDLALDGEPTGRLPAAFTVLPHALPTIVPSVPARVFRLLSASVTEVRTGAAAAAPLRMRC